MRCAEENQVYRLVAGGLAPEDRIRLERHLECCASCAKLRDELGHLTERLKIQPGELDDPEMDEAIMTLVRLDRTGRPVKRGFERRWMSYSAAAFAVATLTVLVFALWPRFAQVEEKSSGFYARGAAGQSDNRWVSIEVFRATDRGYERVRGSIKADDALAFSYINRNNPAYRFLMIFAVDTSGRVFWYYPAYTDSDANPLSIPIRSAKGPVALSDEVQHDIQSGSLRLFAIFSMTALEVRAIEDAAVRALRASRSLEKLEHLDLPETGQQSILLSVTPKPTGGNAR